MKSTKALIFFLWHHLFNAIDDKEKMHEGRFAGLYDLAFNIFLKKIQNKILNIVTCYKCKRIVDLGCGTGSQCILLHANKFDVTGIDISPSMLAVARKKNSKIDYICGDIINTNFPDGHFDCAILSFVLHMNNPKNQQKILREAERIVGREGLIIVTDYGIPSTPKGKTVGLLIKIIENLAVEEHRNNYHEYVKRGSIDGVIKNKKFTLERYKFYFGTIETVVIKK